LNLSRANSWVYKSQFPLVVITVISLGPTVIGTEQDICEALDNSEKEQNGT